MKIMLVVCGVLLLAVLVLILILCIMNKKLKCKQNEIFSLMNETQLKDGEIKRLKEEMEIEKKHKNELAKKLAIISCMPIDDILKQLQNN